MYSTIAFVAGGISDGTRPWTYGATPACLAIRSMADRDDQESRRVVEHSSTQTPPSTVVPVASQTLRRATYVPRGRGTSGQWRSLTGTSSTTTRTPFPADHCPTMLPIFQAGGRPPRCTMISAESTESRPSRCAATAAQWLRTSQGPLTSVLAELADADLDTPA
jgi:hypothetical protein